MSIITKTGDKGQTGLFGSKRVSKSDLQIEAIGAIDEVTSFIGFVFESLDNEKQKSTLVDIQKALYMIMAHFSEAQVDKKVLMNKLHNIENEINNLEKILPKLNQFILPQGSELSTRFHLARVTTRSAERRIVAYVEKKSKKTKIDEIVLQYINRLSDLLFLMARKYNHDEKTMKEA